MDNAVELWLRCNKCYRSTKKTARTFVLTQCQHVFCGKCRDGVEKACPECQTRDVQTVSLVKPLPEQLAHYFARVGISVQQSFEASRFQRTQMSIVIRRLDLIQERYEEMKRTYYEGATRMKSLLAAYEQEKEKNAKLSNELAQLRSMASQLARPTTNSSYARPPAVGFIQQDRRTLDYVMASAQSRDNDARSSCLGAPCPPLARPIAVGPPNRHSRLQHAAQENRSKVDPEYRFRMPQADVLQYPKRAIPSYIPQTPHHMDAGWIARNRVPSSLGGSSKFSSSDAGTMRR